MIGFLIDCASLLPYLPPPYSPYQKSALSIGVDCNERDILYLNVLYTNVINMCHETVDNMVSQCILINIRKNNK